MTFLVDSHCHLADLTFDDQRSAQLIIQRARASGVTHFMTVSCTLKDFAKNYRFVEQYENIFAACGIHPLNVEDEPDWSEDALETILKKDRVLALGETGLDFHYMPETRDLQLKVFARHLELAVALKKPLVIHAREARRDTVDLLRATGARDAGGVIHCFTDTKEMARECLDLGFYISFTGIATFKPSDNVREVVRYVPLDRMMVETDCPYLAPVPVRGRENEPAYVRYTLSFIADFLNISEEELARITSENFEKLYGVKLKAPEPMDAPSDLRKIEKIANHPFARR